ncbi:MAG: hypothetical protein JW891_16615, partial [Candidatus Lokiarchaeota archaeon]|nr:hypothetical protein [Candidatus Lokiarchaeota archaeon]
FSLIGFVVGLLLSFPMYFLLLITKKIRKYSFDYINVQSKNNLFVTTIKHSFMTSLFSFNFAFILIKIPLVLDYFVDISTFEGSSSIIPQVYGYFALLPLTIFITSSIYTAIWLLSYCDLYATSVKENQIVKRHNIANSYSDIIRNFTEISSIITLILFSFDYYNDVVNSGYDIPLFSILAFPVFALLVCPLYFFILNVLVIKINPLKKYIYRIY